MWQTVEVLLMDGLVNLESTIPGIIADIFGELKGQLPSASIRNEKFGLFDKAALRREISGRTYKDDNVIDPDISSCELHKLNDRDYEVFQWIRGWLLRAGWEPISVARSSGQYKPTVISYMFRKET